MEYGLNDIKRITDGDGVTLKNGKVVSYKTGWQVATAGGYEVTTAEECYEAVKALNGNCGIWYDKGIYYVDNSFRVKTLKKALEIGRREKQISIFGWKLKNLVYC